MSERNGLTAKLPLKVLTPLALVLPVLVVVGIIGVVVYVQGQAAARSLEIRGVEQVHGRIGDRLRTLLDGPPRWHAMVAANIRSGALDPADLRAWREPIYRQRHAFDAALAGVTWGDPAGHAFWVFRYPGKPFWELGIKDDQTDGKLVEYPLAESGRVLTDQARVSDYDPRVRPWYQLGVAAGAAGAWGEPYTWVIGEAGGARNLGLPFAAAILDEAGDLRGVLDTELGLADLSSFLRSLSIGKSGLAVITDRRGRLIATSTNANLADHDLNRISALASEDGDLRAMAKRLQALFPEGRGNAPSQWTGEVELAERGDALMSVSGFKHRAGLNWVVMTAVPTADFTAEVDAIRARGIRIILVSVGVTLLIGMALAAWLVRPVLRLTSHARQVGAGDLDTALKLNQARELVELSTEFNNMTAGLRDRLSLRKSLAHASEVQQSLLPNADPQLPGFDIVGHCNYCDETGGDYYDYLEDDHTQEHGTSVVIGDVMGHGIAAAMLMATARGVLRSKCQDASGIAELLTHLNQLLVEVTGGMKFMTMLIAHFDHAPAPGNAPGNKQPTLRWASAGHDAPMIYNPEDDTFREPAPGSGGGLPLGVMEEEVYELAEAEPLTPGSIVLIATDGMWETRNEAGEMHNKARLQASIRRHAKKTSADIRDGLLHDLHTFRGQGPQDDDETFVVIKVVGN